MQQNSQAYHKLLAYLRHELCTPISGMIGYSELLLEALPDQLESSTLAEDLQKIHGCAQRLLTLVSVILDPDQLESSQIDGDLSNFGATLRMELLTPLSTIIGYCEMLLEEVPAKLIPDMDKLHGSALQLLSLINDIVHLAQQQLQSLTSAPDETLDEVAGGAKLSLQSPEAAYLAKSAADTLEALTQPSTQQFSGGMILVIDDNPTNCDLLARRLKQQAYGVTTATNAQQALRLLQAISYDLILLDVIMPGVSGLSLLQQLKQHKSWRHIPVIMISALDEMAGAVKCIELGAEDYLHKPFDPTLLKARISACLEKKRLRDQEIFYLQQVERLTVAAAAVETQSFDPNSLDDLSQQPDRLGQLARVFQRMAREVRDREQSLEQQLETLQVSINSGQTSTLVTEIATSDHFQQLQKRTKGNLDIENLYRPSLYPPLSGFDAGFDTNFSGEGDQHMASEEQTSSSDAERSKAVQITGPLLDNSSNSLANHSSKIVAVHSFRGGTGKSSLTSNLAVRLAQSGQRVGIIDTDLQSPGVHVLFGLEDGISERGSGCTLNNYLWGECALHEAARDVSSVLNDSGRQSSDRQPSNQPPAPGGAIYLVPASTQPNDITRIVQAGYDKEKLLEGFDELIRDLGLDVLLIDTHPGINEETLQAIAACALLVLVLRPDYQDYQGTAVIAELARLLSVEDMLLVVNKALPAFNVEAYQQQLETAYDVSVAQILPFAEEMMHLASSDIFALRYPDHALTQAMDAISQHIIQPSSAQSSSTQSSSTQSSSTQSSAAAETTRYPERFAKKHYA